MMTLDGNNSLKRLNIKGQMEYNSYSRSNYRLNENLVDECHGQTRGEQKAAAKGKRAGRAKKSPLVRLYITSLKTRMSVS